MDWKCNPIFNTFDKVIESWLERPGNARLTYDELVSIEKPVNIDMAIRYNLVDVIKSKVYEVIKNSLGNAGIDYKHFNPGKLKIIDW